MKDIEETHKEVMKELRSQSACQYASAVVALADCRNMSTKQKEDILIKLNTYFA